jgi:hypothetical protein
MGKQIHKRLADEQVRGLLERYCSGEVALEYILRILEIKRRQFFKLLKRYREDSVDFSIAYNRQKKIRHISREGRKEYHQGIEAGEIVYRRPGNADKKLQLQLYKRHPV